MSDIHQGSAKDYSVCFIPVPSISRSIVTDMQGQGKWEEGKEGGEGKGRGRREGKGEKGREGGGGKGRGRREGKGGGMENECF